MDYRSAHSDWLIVFLFHIVAIRNRLDLQKTALQLLATPACAFEFANATFILLVWSLLVVVVAAFVVFVDIFDPFLVLLFWVGVSSLLPGSTGSLTGVNSFVAWWRSCYRTGSQMFVWLGTQKIAPSLQSFWNDPSDSTATFVHWQCKFHEVSSASSWHPAISSSQPLPCHMAISWNIFAPVIFAPRILN